MEVNSIKERSSGENAIETEHEMEIDDFDGNPDLINFVSQLKDPTTETKNNEISEFDNIFDSLGSTSSCFAPLVPNSNSPLVSRTSETFPVQRPTFAAAVAEMASFPKEESVEINEEDTTEYPVLGILGRDCEKQRALVTYEGFENAHWTPLAFLRDTEKMEQYHAQDIARSRCEGELNLLVQQLDIFKTVGDIEVKRLAPGSYDIVITRNQIKSALRKKNDAELQAWIDEINKIVTAGPNPEPALTAVNEIDFSEPPNVFQYSNDYVAANGVPNFKLRSDEILDRKCVCDPCKPNSSSNCCPAIEGQKKFPYRDGLLNGAIASKEYVIYECGLLCLCGSECPTRVVQKKRKLKLEIFKTPHKGWGLRSKEKISKGQFIVEYVGELITVETANNRSTNRDYPGHTYMFDLNVHGYCKYVIDATSIANCARFMNHSCDPNCVGHFVFFDSGDPFLPRLAFFALRTIEAGEELTFDYAMQQDVSSKSPTKFVDGTPLADANEIPCKCMSKKCWKSLVTPKL